MVSLRGAIRAGSGLAAVWMFLFLLVTAAITPVHAQSRDVETLQQATEEIPEENLLDVAVRVFNPGIPADEDERTLNEEGIFKEIRKSESRFFPVHLKRTLQATGQWGAVRVVPAPSLTSEVWVRGVIVESNGHKLVLDISAGDVAGRNWLKKRYKEIADTRAYGDDELAPEDPFQSLYNRVVNDMLVARNRLRDEQVQELRRIAGIRFAGRLAPEPFDSYLRLKRNGRLTVERLPAEGDPMMARIDQIRERDYMFVDALNEHYASLYAKMLEPYDNWRTFSYDEQLALTELRRAARLRKILGAVAILGGVMVDNAPSGTRDIAIIGGMAAISSGVQKGREAKMHREGLRELGQSFDAEIAPIVMEVDGQVLRLTGSAETQYESWQELLANLWATETGEAPDPNADPALRDAGTGSL